MPRNFQSRLGAKMDKLKRKLIDNSISLSGNTLDFMRITSKFSKQGDLESRTIDEIGVIEVVMPPMIDVPMRRVKNDAGTLSLDSMDVHDLFPFDCYTLNKYNIDKDDLLIRVIQDPEVDRPYVMVLQVKDTMMTLGNQSPIWKTFKAVYYDNQLPAEILTIITQAQTRRVSLGW